jgi:antibiotic biosynthesis monooxygenase (ABM) superfamily enzyme
MGKATVSSNEPVTALFSLTVRKGKEQEFETLMHGLHQAARTFPGHMGVTTLKNPARRGSRQTVLRFDSTKHLENWLNSPVRKRLMEPIDKIADSDTYKEATGLETWFDIPGQQIIAPPRWKMVVTTFIGIYPLSVVYGGVVAAHVTHWPLAFKSLFLPVLAPIILTYLFIPFLTQRALKRWLYGNSNQQDTSTGA